MSDMFEKIFEHSPVAMLLVDENSLIQLMNKHAELLFQYTKEELRGENISKLIPKNLKQNHPLLVKDYFSSLVPRKMGVGRVLLGMRKDQTTFPIEVGLNPIQTDKRFFVMSSVIDLTEKSSAEKRFKAAVDASPNGMLMINNQGSIMLCNKKTEEIFGYGRGELIKKPIETLVPNDFQNPHPTFIKNYMRFPEPRAMGMGRELFGKHKSGKLVPVEIGLQPISFEKKNFVISSIVDVSQRREAEKKLHMQSEEIKEFAYRTSHDLKSPLLTVGGLIDYVIEDIKREDLDSSLKGAEKIKTLIVKLNVLIEDIINLSKSDLDHEKRDFFDFDVYFQDALEKFSFLFEGRKLDVQCSFLHDKDLLVQNTRLTQVLDNLMSNAAKYSNPERDGFIKLCTFNDAEKFYIQVEDNGQGIPKKKHGDVFGMFKRFHGGDIEGSGLGLYMVKKHLKKMNAHIHFESTSAGTIFSLEFFMETDMENSKGTSMPYKRL